MESDKLNDAMKGLKAWASEYCADSECGAMGSLEAPQHTKFCRILTETIAEVRDGILELQATIAPTVASQASPSEKDRVRGHLCGLVDLMSASKTWKVNIERVTEEIVSGAYLPAMGEG